MLGKYNQYTMMFDVKPQWPTFKLVTWIAMLNINHDMVLISAPLQYRSIYTHHTTRVQLLIYYFHRAYNMNRVSSETVQKLLHIGRYLRMHTAVVCWLQAFSMHSWWNCFSSSWVVPTPASTKWWDTIAATFLPKSNVHSISLWQCSSYLVNKSSVVHLQ